MSRVLLACGVVAILGSASGLGGCSGPGLEPPRAAGIAPSPPITGDDMANASAKPPAAQPRPDAADMPVPAPIEPDGDGSDHDCTPECGLRSCGSDGCGGTCGTCADGTICGADGQCGCVTGCNGVECEEDAGCADDCDGCPIPVDAGL